LYLRTCSFDFRPERAARLAGYATPNRIADSIDGDLTANLMELSNSAGNRIVLASVDTLFISPSLVRDLESASDVPLLLFATHTHNAPSLAAELPGLGLFDTAFYQEFVNAFASAIRTLAATRPHAAQIMYAERATRLNVNRRRNSLVLDYRALPHGKLRIERKIAMAPNLHGDVDPRVQLVIFENDQKETLAVIWTFAAHPAFYPERNVVSADFPGRVRTALKQAFGADTTVLYLPGLAGSAIPRIPWHAPRSIRELLLRGLPFHPTLPTFTPQTYTAWTNALIAELLLAHADRGDAKDGMLEVDRGTVPAIFSGTAGDLPLNVTRLSLTKDLDLLAFSGEMLGEWRTILDPVLPTNTICSGYAGGPCLYVPPGQELASGGYEVNGFQQYFGLKGEFARDISGQVYAKTREVLKQRIRARGLGGEAVHHD
jgi:hypothetical protein